RLRRANQCSNVGAGEGGRGSGADRGQAAHGGLAAGLAGVPGWKLTDAGAAGRAGLRMAEAQAQRGNDQASGIAPRPVRMISTLRFVATHQASKTLSAISRPTRAARVTMAGANGPRLASAAASIPPTSRATPMPPNIRALV